MKQKISILGAGSMGSGIAQVASQSGHEVVLADTSPEQLDKAKAALAKVMGRLVEKGKMSTEDAQAIQDRIKYTTQLSDFANSGLVIEAIIENLDIKKKVFTEIEGIVDANCILASNTSSLSVASIAAACKKADRVIGIHFFNPAPLMPLVEIIPAVQTSAETTKISRDLIDSWKKVTVLAKDTPGFIVNRVARPFYGEALRIYEEGVADFATIDWAMTELGGFRMGPFTLMDYIGNDVNYTVTETVFAAFYYDPRYKPSFTQKRHSEAGWYGRKSGRGYYNYAEGTEMPAPNKDEAVGQKILNRILVMLINEAIDAVFLNIASAEDVDLAMTKGVNYPKGLLAWADEIGLEKVLADLEALQAEYGEDRYRPSVLLRRMVREGKSFGVPA
ncbi:3-hydroxyacyl-CoA dehydrogenase NAD-binding domain-containing protein [Paracrocinitomix mangrovi]|uniref:3-hydroxyacyl-CoA dehydrogenase NAD-binding domain-containing protein n=1 Tax=Paracrocinitomix mangrovi TaxID=2862509 RepID=UPI001C8E387F|nr:3-hydroxyacyl-CoA dehydrogenase NAD-binding domain-containing protein [Paracrocinitomix mangrovi]UKN02796.1 3-hydroxyacyl-CoA dehydrogenase NAD-binding domain-containing protein [Paracrocinitomix mangrovi]